MIIFEYVSVKNFLSWGDQWVTFNFIDHHTTLVQGQSGSGKSSLILDALFFGLFGKSYKNINKPSLINSVNSSGLEVIVQFQTMGHTYRIERGIKPNKLSFYEDDEMFSSHSESRDDQKFLEKNILRMNDKIFRQIVFVGSSNYVPFLKLPLQQRREIIEEILSIKIYSFMLNNVKEKCSQKEMQLVRLNSSIEYLKKQIVAQEDMKKTFKECFDQEIKELEQEISDAQQKQQDVIEARMIVEQKINKLLSGTAKTFFSEEQEKLKHRLNEIQFEMKKLNKEITFFKKESQCFVCEQTIEEQFKHQQIELKTDLKTQLLKEQETTHAYLTSMIEKVNSILEFETLEQQLSKKYKDFEKTISRCQQQIQTYLEKSQNQTIFDDQLYVEYEQTLKTKNDVLEEIHTCKLVMPLLKDSGVKSMVIKKYLSKMNTLLNEYLTILNLPILFYINDEFKEEIRSRYRDVFSYENFSDGEKARIDLAIMLLLREMARIKNNLDSNLIVFDEADAALDDTSRKAFFLLYRNVLKDKNIIVISHHASEESQDKYQAVYQIEKLGNFSTIKKV